MKTDGGYIAEQAAKQNILNELLDKYLDKIKKGHQLTPEEMRLLIKLMEEIPGHQQSLPLKELLKNLNEQSQRLSTTRFKDRDKLAREMKNLNEQSQRYQSFGVSSFYSPSVFEIIFSFILGISPILLLAIIMATPAILIYKYSTTSGLILMPFLVGSFSVCLAWGLIAGISTHSAKKGLNWLLCMPPCHLGFRFSEMVVLSVVAYFTTSFWYPHVANFEIFFSIMVAPIITACFLLRKSVLEVIAEHRFIAFFLFLTVLLFDLLSVIY